MSCSADPTSSPAPTDPTDSTDPQPVPPHQCFLVRFFKWIKFKLANIERKGWLGHQRQVDRWCKDRASFTAHKNVRTVFDMPFGLYESRSVGSKKRICRQDDWWEGERRRQLEKARARQRKKRAEEKQAEGRAEPLMAEIVEED